MNSCWCCQISFVHLLLVLLHTYFWCCLHNYFWCCCTITLGAVAQLLWVLLAHLLLVLLHTYFWCCLHTFGAVCTSAFDAVDLLFLLDLLKISVYTLLVLFALLLLVLFVYLYCLLENILWKWIQLLYSNFYNSLQLSTHSKLPTHQHPNRHTVIRNTLRYTLNSRSLLWIVWKSGVWDSNLFRLRPR